MTTNQNEFSEVFSGTSFQAGMVKSLLENADIRVFLRDEFLGVIASWWASPGGAGAVKVFVPGADFERAMEVVAEYEANINAN